MTRLRRRDYDREVEHPFRVHFLDADRRTHSRVIRALTPDAAVKAFAANPENQWFEVVKTKLDRSEEHA